VPGAAITSCHKISWAAAFQKETLAAHIAITASNTGTSGSQTPIYSLFYRPCLTDQYCGCAIAYLACKDILCR